MPSTATSTPKSGQLSSLPSKRDGNPTTVVNLFENRQPRVAQNAAAALQEMPHLVERICLLWGQGQAEFESYANRLMLDSRDGARKGLPWHCAEEIMFLAELSMAKRALHASEVTGVPFSQMFSRVKDTAERASQGGGSSAGLSLAPKSDPWGDPRANADTAKREKPAAAASSNPTPQKSGWLGKLLG